MKIKSPAKINLALDILGKDKSGYHLIQTIFHEIDLYDIIEIKETPRGIKIECNDKDVPTGKENTIYKAVKLLGAKSGVHIKITKKIPIGSGLGGAASNAAATLKALNKMWHLKLNQKLLAELGSKIGMDVPFFIYGKTALGTHFGEKIKKLPHIKNLKIDLKFSNKKISTKEAYSRINLKACGKNKGKTKEIITAIRTGDAQKIIKNIHSDFEKTLPTKWHLTGSGSAKFNIRFSPAKP